MLVTTLLNVALDYQLEGRNRLSRSMRMQATKSKLGNSHSLTRKPQGGKRRRGGKRENPKTKRDLKNIPTNHNI